MVASVAEKELRRARDVAAQSREASTAGAAAALQPDGAVQRDVTANGLDICAAVTERRDRWQEAKRRRRPAASFDPLSTMMSRPMIAPDGAPEKLSVSEVVDQVRVVRGRSRA